MGWRTAARVTVWQSDMTLWSDAVWHTPLKPRPVMNLGRAYELQGDDAMAETLYRKVIWLTFDERRSEYVRKFSQAAAETNLAHLHMKAGRMAQAMKILDMTISTWPDFPYAQFNRGSILWAYGACEDATKAYAVAQAGDPSLPMPVANCNPMTRTLPEFVQ